MVGGAWCGLWAVWSELTACGSEYSAVSSYGQYLGAFNCERKLVMVEPQVLAFEQLDCPLGHGLYWLIEMTPSAMRELMLDATFQFASMPAAEPAAP